MWALFQWCSSDVFTVCCYLSHFLWGAAVGSRDKTGLSALQPCRTGLAVTPKQTHFQPALQILPHAGSFTAQWMSLCWQVVCGASRRVDYFFDWVLHRITLTIFRAISIFCYFNRGLSSGALTLCSPWTCHGSLRLYFLTLLFLLSSFISSWIFYHFKSHPMREDRHCLSNNKHAKTSSPKSQINKTYIQPILEILNWNAIGV